MADVSHNGYACFLAASKTTLGIPFPIMATPKDTDPFDMPNVDVADLEIGTNGDPISWTVINPMESTIALIPATGDYELLQKVADSNRAEKGKPSVRDLMTLTRTLPNGETITAKGYLTNVPVAFSLSSSGKIKTPTFGFKWFKVYRTPSTDIVGGF
jgi:hypothetical protein